MNIRLAMMARPRRGQIEWLSFVLLLGASCLVSAAFFNNDRKLAHQAEVGRLQAQIGIIDENLRHQLEGARGALVNLRHSWQSGAPDAVDAQSLDAMRVAMPGVRALLVRDLHGRTLLASGGQGHGVAVNAPDPEKLYLSHAGGALALTLRMAAGDGPGKRAPALVTALLDASYFDVVMRSVLYAPDMRSAILEGGGAVLLYAPPNARGEAEPGVTRLVVRRHFAPASLGLDQQLTITLSRDVAAMNAPWLRLAVVYFAAWLLVALLAALMLLVLQRRRRASRETAQSQQQEKQRHAARIELALAGADLGLWDWHLPSGVRQLDERGAGMLGYTTSELDSIAMFYRHVHADDVAAVHDAVCLHLRGGSPWYEAEFRMLHRDGHWIWVHSRGKIVERDAGGGPLRMVGTRMDISGRKLAEARIHNLAFYDGLTALPNRRLLLERLAQSVQHAARSGRHGAVLFLDLDNFKQLNDTLGHAMGDRLLQSVARRLVEVTRSNDTVARLGGDEFIILLEDLDADAAGARHQVDMIGAKILGCLGLPHQLEGHDAYSTSSIGAALFGGDGHCVEDLLRQADLAMYEAKAGGGGLLRFFDPLMQQRISDSVSLEEELRRALAGDEFVLHYQVIVGLRHEIRGVEALLRWRHPQRGMVGPDKFIALAEKTGLILPLGLWVLQQACRQLRRWADDTATAHWTMAVNVSALQFRQDDFVQQVLQVLRDSGANACQLKLELTESMLLDDIDSVAARMAALRAEGIGFSLDDFGTGYSSLAYLKKLPLSQLKIDRSFVQDVLSNANDAAIARAIIALAHSLGLDVVAEGVETQAQRDFLAGSGCRLFQGYLFGKPAPVQALARRAVRAA